MSKPNIYIPRIGFVAGSDDAAVGCLLLELKHLSEQREETAAVIWNAQFKIDDARKLDDKAQAQMAAIEAALRSLGHPAEPIVFSEEEA